MGLKNELTILIAEDDEGHASLILKNLKRAGISNQIIHFKDGEEVLQFFFEKNNEKESVKLGNPYLLLLDVRMPKVDGVEVLTKLKESKEFCKMPIIMLTTTEDPIEVERCHSLGCNSYVTKPIDYQMFVNVIHQLGLFIMILEVPAIHK